jgi:glyoxalase/bleomycin resistance protein/dioxygenase superfamily protein
MAAEKQALPVQALKAHVAINVNSVTDSIEFYRKFWGIEPSKVRSGYAKFDVQNPPLNLTLNEVSFKGSGALSHMGIQVASTEAVVAVRERWYSEGLVPRDEMQTSCCYALQDKTWVSDPDGNQWEVFVVLQDNLPATGACECGDQVADSTEAVLENRAANSCCAPSAPVGIGR